MIVRQKKHGGRPRDVVLDAITKRFTLSPKKQREVRGRGACRMTACTRKHGLTVRTTIRVLEPATVPMPKTTARERMAFLGFLLAVALIWVGVAIWAK